MTYYPLAMAVVRFRVVSAPLYDLVGKDLRTRAQVIMATEPFVPEHRDSVFVDDELPPARAWYACRPGEVAFDPETTFYGSIGPDAGYVGSLVEVFDDRIDPHEADRDDVVAAAKAIAMRRASRYGRAPIAEDLEVGLLLLGAVDDVPGEWGDVTATVVESVRGLAFPVAAGRANDFAEAFAPEWIDPKPRRIREQLRNDGPAAIYATAKMH